MIKNNKHTIFRYLLIKKFVGKKTAFFICEHCGILPSTPKSFLTKDQLNTLHFWIINKFNNK